MDFAAFAGPSRRRPTRSYRLGADGWEPPVPQHAFETAPPEIQAMYRASAFVKGAIRSAPLDLADRQEEFRHRMDVAGWRMVGIEIDTDFGDSIPLPGAKDFKVWVHRKTLDALVPEDAGLAEAAVKQALADMDLDYSAIGRWAGEVKREVIVPTIDTFENPLAWPVPWWTWPAVGLVGAAIAFPYVSPILSRLTRR